MSNSNCPTKETIDNIDNVFQVSGKQLSLASKANLNSHKTKTADLGKRASLLRQSTSLKHIPNAATMEAQGNKTSLSIFDLFQELRSNNHVLKSSKGFTDEVKLVMN